MGSSLKSFPSSVTGRLLTGALTLGGSQFLAERAEAVDITNIKQAVAKLCIGSNAGGVISGQELGWEAVLTDAKSTGFSTTNSQAFKDKMYNPLKFNYYQAGTHRNFAYTKWPADNDIVEGYYLYDVNDPNNVKKSFVINSSNYPGYKEETRVHFVKGATPDQDQMVFLNYDVVEVYKSPFDANGKVKLESKVGPISPHFTKKLNFSADTIRAAGNTIIGLDDSGTDPVVHKLIINANAVVEDKNVVLKGVKASDLGPIESGFITVKNSNGIATTYFLFQSGGKMTLVDINNPDNYKDVNGIDFAVEDPDGRYMFKYVEDGSGNDALYVTDMWAAKPVDVKVLDGDVGFPLEGLLAYAAGFKGPAWVLYGEDEKARLIELEDPVTMKVKVTGVPFGTFKDKFGKFGVAGGQACVTLPGQVPVITKTGTVEPPPEPNPEPAPEAVEAADAPDAGAETEVIVTPDAIDGWLDGDGDMQDIFKEEVDGGGTPDSDEISDDGDSAGDGETATPPVDGVQDAPDQSVPETDDAKEDVPEQESDAKVDPVDGVVTPPDMSTNETKVDATPKDNTAVAADTGKTGGDGGAPASDPGSPAVDAGSNDSVNKPPVTKPPVKPAEPDCNAGSNGNGGMLPTVVMATIALAITRARRREEEKVSK